MRYLKKWNGQGGVWMLDFILNAYLARREAMVALATVAYNEMANNYRKFRVGAAVLMMNDCGEFQVFEAGNIKRRCRKGECACEDEESEEHIGHKQMAANGNPPKDAKGKKARKKCCAERIAIRKGLRAKYKSVAAVVLYADNQRDDDSGVLCRSLTPCKVCRAYFVRLMRAKQMSKDCIIYSVNAKEKDVRPEEQVLWQVFERHGHPYETGVA